LTAAAESRTENKPVIAVLKRCATQKQQLATFSPACKAASMMLRLSAAQFRHS
jgi:hypothetical protein